MRAAPCRVLLVLPYPLMARNVIYSGVLERLRDRTNAEVLVVTPSPADAAHVQGLSMAWAPLFHPLRWEPPGRAASRTRRYWWYLRYGLGRILRMGLVYRFNVIRGFRGFAVRMRQSMRLRREFLADGLPMSRVFGIPCARSERLYRWLYRAYYSRWQRFRPVDALFRSFQPTLMVLGHLQTALVTPYVLAAQAARVRILGINGSWDQPTTKGPLCPGVERLLVQNEQVREELRNHHGVPDKLIATVGWPQMDLYARVETFVERSTFLRQCGYAHDERYILFAANPGRLSRGEPEIAAWLAQGLREGRLGPARLHVRCHPNDSRWRERLGAFASHPSVTIEPPRQADLRHLANLVRHAEVVVASAGSMNLDAIALDTPTIGLAWEDKSQVYWDRQARLYDLEHLAAAAGGEAFPLAHTYEELEALIKEALFQRSRRAEGRRALRERLIGPLDGQAAHRIAAEIAAMLEHA